MDNATTKKVVVAIAITVGLHTAAYFAAKGASNLIVKALFKDS